MKKWIEQIKAKFKNQEFDYKQMFLGIVIFIFAIVFLTVAFHSEEEKTTETYAISKVITNKLNKETRFNRVSKIVSDNKAVEENVTLNFETVTERAMEYKIYYTTKSNDSFDDNNVILYKGQTGAQKYSIPLPVKQISRFRIELEPQAGNVTFKNINLTGTQQADLNKVEQYEFYQVENIKINEDNSISFLSRSRAPALVYYQSLLPTEEIDEKTEEEIKNREKE